MDLKNYTQQIQELAKIRQKREMQIWKNETIQTEIDRENMLIEENQLKIWLPKICRLTSEEVTHTLQFFDLYTKQLQTLELQTKKVLDSLETQKDRLIPGSLSEVVNIILDTKWDQSKNTFVRTGAEVLSTWLSTRGLDTETSQQLVTSLNTLLDTIKRSEQQLNQFGIESNIQWLQVQSLPNLKRLEYVDLAQDILRPAKNRWSVASLLAQTYTWWKISTLIEQLNTLTVTIQKALTEIIPQKTIELHILAKILTQNTQEQIQNLLNTGK